MCVWREFNDVFQVLEEQKLSCEFIIYNTNIRTLSPMGQHHRDCLPICLIAARESHQPRFPFPHQPQALRKSQAKETCQRTARLHSEAAKE